MALDPVLMSTSEAALYLGLSASFLNKLRCTGGGPGYVKLGRRVLYPKAELEAWIEARRRQSTSEAPSPNGSRRQQQTNDSRHQLDRDQPKPQNPNEGG